MAFGWVKDFSKNWMGESDYGAGDVPDRKIDTARGDEERALGLESRGQQQQLGQYYQDRLAGKTPSVAEMQQARGTRQAMAVGASGRGTNVAMAQRNAAMVGQQGAADAAMLRAQEQAQAAKQYSDLVQAQRMQDLLARGYSVEEAKAQLAYYGQVEGAKLSAASEEAARKQKGAGGIFTAIGYGLSSDVRTKEDIEPVGMGLRPSPARTTYIDQSGPPPVRTGGGMTTLQMNNPRGDYYGVGDFQAEQPAPPAAAPPEGPSLLQRIGAGLGGYGDALTGGSSAMDMIKSQQADTAAKEESKTSKPAGEEEKSGIGPGAAKALIALSDRNSKEEIQNLRSENESLRKAVGSGVVAASKGDAVPHLMKRGAMRPGASTAQEAVGMHQPTDMQTGGAAMGRLEQENPALANRVFNQTIPPTAVTENRADVHKAAAGDYATRLENWRQAQRDRSRDLAALERAAAPEAGRVSTPGMYYPPGAVDVEDQRAARAQEVLSDMGAKEPLASDERMKQDLQPLLTAIKARGREMSGQPSEGSTAAYEKPASSSTAAYPLTEQAAAIPAYKFRYKEPYAQEYGAEPRVGVMAQDLERVPATAPTVKEGPDGLKRVDAGQLTMTNTAMISDLARKLDEFEKKFGKSPEEMQKLYTQPAAKPKKGKASTQDVIDAIRALKSEMPRPDEKPFDQRTGEIERANPYSMPDYAWNARQEFLKRGGTAQKPTGLYPEELQNIPNYKGERVVPQNIPNYKGGPAVPENIPNYTPEISAVRAPTKEESLQLQEMIRLQDLYGRKFVGSDVRMKRAY